MAWFIGKRLLGLVLTLLVLSFVVFSLLQLAPGDPVQTLLGTRRVSPEAREVLKERWHLDQSFLAQYWYWLKGVVHLDLGESPRTGQEVMTSIGDRIGVSAFLAIYGFVIALALGLPLGVFAAIKRRTSLDRGVVGLSVIGVSAPAFVTGVVLIYVFGVQFEWFPVFGAGTGFFDQIWHLTLPAFALALGALALIVKITRTAMIRVLEQDYISFAISRGVPPRRVMVRHALRNAAIPIVTASGQVLVALITGAVIVEATFALPGLGTLLLESVEAKDIPVLQGVILVLAALVILVNLAVDLTYSVIDPRIRLGEGA